MDALARDQGRTLSYARCRGMGPKAWSEQARAALPERLDFSPEPVPLDARVLLNRQMQEEMFAWMDTWI